MFDGHFPLVYYGKKMCRMLQEALGTEMTVFVGMRYGRPFIGKQIDTILKEKYEQLILLPMFPQYASSSSGLVLECALNSIKKRDYGVIPKVRIIPPFYDNPLFIKSFAERIRQTGCESYEQILFAYHSLPMSHVKEVEGTRYDYEKACRKTSELIACELNLKEGHYTTSFQSQMSSKWLKPFTNDVIADTAKYGVKSLLVVAPSFVADCLETSLELGEEAKEIFLSNGGEKYALVESLNDSPLWLDCLKDIVSTK